jgi:hypothetical protein
MTPTELQLAAERRADDLAAERRAELRMLRCEVLRLEHQLERVVRAMDAVYPDWRNT